MQNLCTQREDEGGVAAGTSATADLGHIPQEKTPFHIPVSADMDGLISQALLVGNFEGAVELCLNDGRYAEAILLSISGGEELLKKTQQRYLNKQTNSISMLISSVVMQNWRDIVQGCELDNWKEALAALLTYANPEDFSALCDILGSRLEAVGTEKSCLQACLCYICSGNIHKLDLVEKVMVLQKSVERLRSSEVTVKSSVLEDKLIQYARVLASQGSLETALSYLPEKSDKVCMHGQYPSAVPTQMSQLGQPAIPVIPTTHTPGVPCPTNRPVYPKYPATAPGFPPSQPERAPLGFTTGPNLPPSSLPAPASPQSSAPGLIMPVPVPTMPPLSAPGFLPSKSMPPVPPTSLPGGPVSMFSGITQTQSPAPPPPSTAFPSAGAGYPQGGPGAPGTKNITASAVPPPPTGAREGWNDPPAIRVGPRSKKVPGDYMPPAPITAPVMSLPADTPLPQDRGQVPPGAPQEPSLQILQQLPAERVEQREIPSEHMILKTTFDSLVQRCQLAATDPQTKRKLDDSSKRISSLYEKLRDQVLSPSILAGLHEISNCMAVRNYLRGLEVHTQVVSSSNFSEISAFMPVLKVLMTIANKLGV
ncbi:hypothetical protein P4O66_011340 [Electrophorus voltai]|uniref:Sec16 Sec23-binding domain-containing protein n=1 Tax=Electrophorus voltai TaxID=2609070 RepID=A0AAD8Z7F3_9TELE|nr:hypothetical protein P4O66_011340 [Electrophorus voltai]